MKYQKIHNRPKGTIETFSEDASVASDISALTVANMVASIASGSSAEITTQSYNSGEEALYYQVRFSEIGSTAIKVVTTFTGSAEAIVSVYKFRTTNDGTGSMAVGYE